MRPCCEVKEVVKAYIDEASQCSMVFLIKDAMGLSRRANCDLDPSKTNVGGKDWPSLQQAVERKAYERTGGVFMRDDGQEVNVDDEHELL